MTGTEQEQRMELEDRVRDQQEAVELLDPAVGGAVFTRAECTVIASALAVSETASAVTGIKLTPEQRVHLEQLRLKACAGAAR